MQPEYNGAPVAQEDMEKLCRTGMVNATTGRWASKIKSKNKGKVCTTDADCPTTDSNVNAKCKCGFNTNGDKYWDIEAGDDEWVKATNLFNDYHLLNLDCHTGEGYGKCGQEDSIYSQYRCAEFKAKHYVELINNPKCLKETYKLNPFFWEYYMHWSAFSWSFSLFFLLILAITIVLDN